MDDLISFDETLSDDEVVTAAGVLKSLEEAWLNEKLSPEILPHKIEQVDCMMEQIHHMEENLKKLDKNDFRVGLHKLELDRIRYLITSYLRTRIDKIETYALKILEDESTRDPGDRYLSPSEFSFAKEYVTNLNGHFKSLFVGLPESLQDLDTNQIMINPNLESHVFVKASSNVQGVIVDDGDNREEEVSLEDKSQHILPYKAVSEYVKNGQVQLI
ncbi:DNA replication complex GINS protein SLD5-like [Macrosteles quadrilineatus]|uniref:DNA replication complex GINS protein SLD5-like n=1 Tax=Macrosteles quadrilineatus TaxID=74068 RepID=UPI0023E200CC|nr:DNA replication complex GINS protein SLD5-like [Macrosteles quadrilineatus]XP_054289572.1 DNA replication complex GINS protein SLD5-like [Macrosteles quadrilineatus]